MILIFGGAYQGKLDYAKANFKVKNICHCGENVEPDFSADAICDIENFVMGCVKNGMEAKTFFQEKKSFWQDKILVITDTSQGVVPVEKKQRDFREMNGRLLLYLAGEADRVIRVFCGIGKDIKREEK